MKKGDQIKKIEIVEMGTEVAHNFSSMVLATKWAEGCGMPVKVKESIEFSGVYHVVLKEDYSKVTRALVNWRVDREMGLTNLETGLCFIDYIEGWVVEIESSPSYQSSVEELTEQQLRDSLDNLRTKRVKSVKVTKGRKVSIPKVKLSPMEKALEGLSPERKKELMEKLGMV